MATTEGQRERLPECAEQCERVFLHFNTITAITHHPGALFSTMGSLSSNGASGFTAAPSIHVFAGFLFDMDGTIIDSTDAIVKHWHK